MLLKDYLDEWLGGYGASRLKPSTAFGYRKKINSYVLPALGEYELSALTPYLIQNWVYDLHQHGRSRGRGPLNPKTVIQAYRILSRSLKSACRLGLLAQNPCSGVELPRRKRYDYCWLTDTEAILSFLAAFRDFPYCPAVVLAMFGGLRRSEVLGLRYDDFDFSRASVLICRSVVQDSARRVVLGDLKNDTSFRSVLLPAFVMDMVAGMEQNSPYLFPASDGGLLHPETFSKCYQVYRDKHGLPKIRFHDLRHSHASLLFSSGIEPRIIQDRLGHSNIKTTLDIYTHTDVNLQMPLVRLLDEMFAARINGKSPPF